MYNLAKAEIKRAWRIICAYPAEAILEAVFYSVLFYMLFLGASYMSGSTASFGDRLDGVVLGYIVWIIMQSTIDAAGRTLQSERTHGTMEQLMMTSHHITTILFVRTWVEVAVALLQCLVVTVVLSLLTGTVLHFSLAITIPLLTVIISASGLGFVLGALIMIFRKLDIFRTFLAFGLLFFVVAPIENWGLYGLLASSFLPIAPSAAALRAIMVHEHFDWFLCSLAIGNAAIYLLAGMTLFNLALRRAKQQGAVSTF